MKHRFALWALLFGVTGAAAQVTTQLGTTTIFPNLVVENTLQAGTSKLVGAAPQLTLGANGGTSGQLTLNGATSGSITISADATGDLGLTAPASKGITLTAPSFITLTGSTVFASNGLQVGGNGGIAGQINLEGSTSGAASVAVDATGNLFTNVPTGKNQNWEFNGTTYGFMNASGFNVGASGANSGNVFMFGSTSGSNQQAVSATGGHLALTASSSPTITAGCTGAGSAVSGTDTYGTITGSTAAATTCTITFGTAYSAAPVCTVTGLNSPLTGAVSIAAATLQVNFASTANYKFNYHCFGG